MASSCSSTPASRCSSTQFKPSWIRDAHQKNENDCCDLVNALVLVDPPARNMSSLITLLNTNFQRSLSHLRRIRRLGNHVHVLIKVLRDGEKERGGGEEEEISESALLKTEIAWVTAEYQSLADLLKGGNHEWKVIKVPAGPAPSREAFNKAHKIWPFSSVPVFPTDPMLKDKDPEIFIKSMQSLLQTLATEQPAHVGDCYCNVAILVDPKSGRIRITEGASLETEMEDCCFFDRHCAVRVISKVAAEDLEPSSSSHDPTSYLLTGYHYYTLYEPCVMCAMALLHSRAKRIYFVYPLQGVGGLVSATRLHMLPSLNHHFDVYQVEISKNDEGKED